MPRRKTNNPFKMWGSYVGAVLFLIFGSIGVICRTNLAHNTGECSNILNLFGIPSIPISNLLVPLLIPFDEGAAQLSNFLYGSLTIILMLLLGFLLGWGIHSIIRAVRN